MQYYQNYFNKDEKIWSHSWHFVNFYIDKINFIDTQG